jgi:hypothetical protein
VKNMRRTFIALFLAALVVLVAPLTALAATRPPLGGAGYFAVLAGTTVTNTGATWISGQVGVAPGTAITGFPPGTSGPQHKGDSTATTAQTNLTAAYTNAAAQPCPSGHNYTGVNLGGKTLGPGVYCQTTAPTLTGTLTLQGAGIYIFQIGSTLITASGSRVRLIGGAQPCDIFWQVGSSATIATSTTFVGTIMALTAISMKTGATLNGRALARNAAVTLDSNRIIQAGGCPGDVFGAPAAGTPPPGFTGPASLGVPWELRGEFPWLLVIGAGAGVGAAVLGVSARRRRRTT